MISYQFLTLLLATVAFQHASAAVRKAETLAAANQNIHWVEANEGQPFKLECGHLNDEQPKSRVFWNLVHNAGGFMSLNSSTITVDPTGDLSFSNVTREDESIHFFYLCAVFFPSMNDFKIETYALQVIPRNATVHQPVAQYGTNGTIDEPPKNNAEGIIYGTSKGLFVLPFISTASRIPHYDSIHGLAFDSNSSRIYWLRKGVGIMRANLDGSDSKILLPDRPGLDHSEKSYGLAIESVSGNLYYGDRSSQIIRVCNGDASRCSTIVNNNDLAHVRDISVHWSQGLLFWSIEGQKIVRANLDGSNATVIVETIAWGMDVDQNKERVYWGSEMGIASCDLNGQDVKILPNVTATVRDVAVHGDRIYYANRGTKSIQVISKLGKDSRLVTKLRHHARYMVVFGMGIPIIPANPCEKSNCTHLCVPISLTSYRCLCSDGEQLEEDGESCKPKALNNE